MPRDMFISYEQLEEPVDPDRQESLMVNMEELVDNIRQVGLINPISVEDLENGTYRVWAGHRRSVAATILQLQQVPVKVYERGHPDLEKIKQAENEGRNPLTDGEECRKYHKLWSQKGMGVEQIAAYLGTKVNRVQSRLDLACGDPAVFDLICEGKLSIAQAAQINKIAHGGFRLQAIELATQHGFGADTLRRWYDDQKKKGVVDAIPEGQPGELAPIANTYDAGADLCNLGGEQTPLLESRLYRICNDHYNLVLKGLERVGQLLQIENAGLLPDYMALLRRAERLVNDGSIEQNTRSPD